MMDFDDTAQKLIKEMSKTDLPKRLNYAKKLQPGTLVDGSGRTFDPDIHMHKNGKPILSKGKNLICKKGKAIPLSQICSVERYKELTQASSGSREGLQPGQSEVIENNNDDKMPKDGLKGTDAGPGATSDDTGSPEVEPLGSASAEMIFILGMAIGGEEWNPTGQERSYMANAFTQYYAAKGLDDLPPGFILTTALITYIAPRLRRPKTNSKIKHLFAWIKNKFFRKRQERKAA